MQFNGYTIFQGPPLNQPAGLGFNPENGHHIAVNQADNHAVELNPRLGTVGPAQLHFGLYRALDDNGELLLYFTNDNTNSINLSMR
ncbi:MAG: hypothetical protein M1499_08510 [Firmicutes bacterium]|nr:hypothetical protein [Bacillota bacterium]